MGHPKIKNFSGLSRVIKGVPKKCGKQEEDIDDKSVR
jgi:hypothetical protein